MPCRESGFDLGRQARERRERAPAHVRPRELEPGPRRAHGAQEAPRAAAHLEDAAALGQEAQRFGEPMARDRALPRMDRLLAPARRLVVEAVRNVHGPCVRATRGGAASASRRCASPRRSCSRSSRRAARRGRATGDRSRPPEAAVVPHDVARRARAQRRRAPRPGGHPSRSGVPARSGSGSGAASDNSRRRRSEGRAPARPVPYGENPAPDLLHVAARREAQYSPRASAPMKSSE